MIRSATNSDKEEITKLIFDVLEEYNLKADPCCTDADLADIKSNYVDRGGCFDVLINEEHQIIGTVGLFPMDNDMCELRKMYLHPSCRGRGFGKKLLEHAIDKARELGFKSIILETAAVLKEAIALYKKYGFEPYQADHLSKRCDQAFIKQL